MSAPRLRLHGGGELALLLRAATATEQAEPPGTPYRPLPPGLRFTGGLTDSVADRVLRMAVALHPLDQHTQMVVFAIGN